RNRRFPRTLMSVRCLPATQRFRSVSCLRRACGHRYRFQLHTSAPDLPVRRGTGCNGGGASDTDRPSGALVVRFQTAGREPSLASMSELRPSWRSLPDVHETRAEVAITQTVD